MDFFDYISATAFYGTIIILVLLIIILIINHSVRKVRLAEREIYFAQMEEQWKEEFYANKPLVRDRKKTVTTFEEDD